MTGITLIPIVPKKPITQVNSASVQEGLRRFAIDMVGRMGRYPAWMPWKSAPKSGAYKGGRRTGTLGRNWVLSDLRPNNVVVSNAVPYASKVQGRVAGSAGERQTAGMKARGWQNITDEALMAWNEHLPDIRMRIAGKQK